MATRSPKPTAPTAAKAPARRSSSKSSTVMGSDEERLRHSGAPEVRGTRSSADDGRTQHDGGVLTKAERQRMLRDEFKQEALPTPPEIPGYHLCWLSTTNSYDPIVKRMRLGYTPVKADELMGFETYKMKSGQYEGMVACNEMVLFKIPTEIWEEIMMEFHHNQPLADEQAIRSALPNQEDKKGKRLVDFDDEDEGMRALGKKYQPDQGRFVDAQRGG